MTLHLVGAQAAEHIRAFLAEDIGAGDITTAAVVPEGASGKARIEARTELVVAGLPFAGMCFALLDDRTTWSPLVDESHYAGAGDVLARVEGSLATILTAERTALNLLMRLSGIATATRSYVDAVSGTKAQIVDTRKTTPGLRMFEKYAVEVGGGHNHRLGLYDAILIKDNHVEAAGGIGTAVKAARNRYPDDIVVQVEVTNLTELDEALEAGATAILLDNMTPDVVREAVEKTAGAAVLEASGGITLENVRSYAETGVDRISVGALTHSAAAVDIALEVE
ncbi:MAG TPA: carboxylating nicotinate-nucleotide diphosphorylase [Actinomycetota bacterium]|nr:carboxylating nicotinate-nucleotide diphosphorylase [Actinomycetota bacterium]